MRKVLRGIFDCRRGEVTGGWSKLYSVEFINIFSLPDGKGWLGWKGHVVCLER